MRAKDFLNLAEQDTIQVMAPFDIETVKQEFSKKAMEFEYSGVNIGNVKFTPEGITLGLQQGSNSAEVTFSTSDDVGPFASIKSASGESVNLDLTPLNPPVVETGTIGKQIDLQNLVWLTKEAFEGIMAAAKIEEVPPGDVVSGEPTDIGSDGSGAATPTSQQPKSPPIELDAKEVPAPRAQGQPSGELPGESYNEQGAGQDDMDKKMLAKGKNFKVILPSGMGEPLYTNSFNAAKEMAKEYGKGTRVVDLSKSEAKDDKVKVSDLPPEVQNQIDVAKKTLKMNDPMAAVMGGMNKTEARAILQKYGLLKGEDLNPKALPGIKLEAVYRVTFKKDKDTEMMDIEANSEADALTKAKSKLKADQKVVSVGKPTKKESKELTYFHFVIREGKRVKIPIGTNASLIEAKKGKQLNKVVSGKPFKPGQYWHKQSEKFGAGNKAELGSPLPRLDIGALLKRSGKPKTDDERRKRHLSRFGTSELPPRGTGKRVKEQKKYYDDDDDTKVCPVCFGGPSKKTNPNCPRCGGTGMVNENKKHNTQYHVIIREGKKVRIPIKRLQEQQVSKKFFITMANAIKRMPDPISKEGLVSTMIMIFQEENPRFDSGRFRLACGV